MKKFLAAFSLVVLIGLGLTACSSDSESSSTTTSEDSLQIVATTSLWGSVVEDIIAGYDNISLDVIYDGDSDPSDYQLTSEDRQKLADADIVVANGGSLDADYTMDLDLHDQIVVSALPVLSDAEAVANDSSNPYIWFDLDMVHHFGDHLAMEISRLIDGFPMRAESLYEHISELQTATNELAETPVVLTSSVPALLVEHSPLVLADAADAAVVLDTPGAELPNAAEIREQASGATVIEVPANTANFFTYYAEIIENLKAAESV